MMPEPHLLEHFKAATYYIAAVIEALAGVIIIISVLEATVRVLGLLRPSALNASSAHQAHEDKEGIRLRMGRWLALALEFELAADILRTAVAPTWDEIGKLAAIITVRTVLNYFLQLEVDKVAARSNTAIRRESAISE